MRQTLFLWTKQEVRGMFSPTTYIRGASYHNEGRVGNVQYDPDRAVWFAEVSGSHVYEVSVQANPEEILVWCDCPAFDTYGECKHLVATMLEICEIPPDRLTAPVSDHLPPKYRMAEQFIQAFSSRPSVSEIPEQHDSRQTLNVEYILKTYPMSPAFHDEKQDLLTIELKVGLQHRYVVKDLRKFLISIEEQSTHYFTKRFTYDPEIHRFQDADRDIIATLHTIMKNEELYRRSYSHFFYGSSSKDRAIVVPPIAADELLTKLKDRHTRFEHEGKTYPQLNVSEDPCHFSFQLDKSDDHEDEFQLDLSELFAASFFPFYGWVFQDGTLYKLSPEQQSLFEVLAGLTASSVARPSLPISKEQIGSFLSHAMPQLKAVGELEITDHVSDHITRPPLKAKVYISEKGETLQVSMEYHYGEFTIHPFLPDEQGETGDDVILIRDAESEQAIMQTIESSSLKIKGNQLYMEKEEEALYDFLYRVLPDLAEKAEIYTSDAVRSLILPNPAVPVTSVDLDPSGNWLDVNFDIDGIEADEIERILQSVVEKKRFHRLPSGAFVSLESDAFQTIRQLMDEVGVHPSGLTENKVQLPLYRGLQIEDIISHSNKYAAKYSKTFRSLVQHLKQPEGLDFQIPETLNATLRDYQVTGFQWLKTLGRYRLGGILADDMGLGKTIQAIAYLLSEKREGRMQGQALVVAPASLVYNWQYEMTKFAPELNTAVVSGTPTERLELLEHSENPDVLITSYPLLRQDIAKYREIAFDALILDEAQMIKNHRTKTFAAVQEIKAARRFALSGTPIENALDELWSIFQAIMPGFFADHASFRELPAERVAKMARPFILRRVKKEVLQELPDKIETEHHLDLTKDQKALYLAYLEKTKQETEATLQQDGFAKGRMKILAALTRLRQICCHPSLFLENYDGKSGKLEQLLELAANAVTGGKRLLIFSQFTNMLQMIHERFAQEGLDCFYLDGQTPSKERVQMAEAFNAGEKDAFLISLKAGGTGLNLTGADTVFLYDLWWNPAVEEQAAGRAHRIGQKNVVQVVRLIARGTIEEKIHEMQQKKKALIEQVIQPGETMLTSMTEEEIREILSI